jgi:hypothetical protein
MFMYALYSRLTDDDERPVQYRTHVRFLVCGVYIALRYLEPVLCTVNSVGRVLQQ